MVNIPTAAFTATSDQLCNVLVSHVHICASYDTQGSSVEPVFGEYKAIWDTGATNTTISSRVVRECNLKPITQTRVIGVDSDGLANVHVVNVRLPSNVEIIKLRTTEAPSLPGADVLIGMDVICQGDFAISNYNGKTAFTFRMPSREKADYIPENGRTTLAPVTNIEEPHYYAGRNDPCPCGSGRKFKKCHLKKYQSLRDGRSHAV